MGIAVVSRHQYSNHQNSSFWPPFWLLPQLKLTPKFSTILTAITHLGTLDTLGTPDTLNPGLTANPWSTNIPPTITLPRGRLRLKLIPLGKVMVGGILVDHNHFFLPPHRCRLT